jgi:DegV family protein with EDD domain
MKYKLIADSCCDLFAADFSTEELNFVTVPLTIVIDDKDFVDDEGLDIHAFVAAMRATKSAAKTCCPSPEAFKTEILSSAPDDNVICLTLSSKLSGSFNSARLAAEEVKKEYPDKNIFVLDSRSASSGMVLILNELKRLIESGDFSFDEIVEKIMKFRDATRVRFVLHDLGNLVRAGRMSKIVGLVASTLNIKPILGDDGKGEIKMCLKVMGLKRPIIAMSGFPAEKAKTEGTDIPIAISHCFNKEDAEYLKSLLETKIGLSNIELRPMRGLSSFYSSYRGIILAY